MKVGKLGVGIVGANWAARGHLPGWRMLSDEVEVHGVCTTRRQTAEAAAEKFGLARAYAGFDAMLADPDIDIVSLGGPPPARYDMTMKALSHGKHVFTCIPFAVTQSQADAMAARQVETGCVGAVDAYFMWTPAYRYLKDLIDDGFLGELYEVSVDFSMSQFVIPQANYAYRWTGYAKNGTGVTPNSCSHIFHTLIHLFGPIVEVVGRTKLAKQVWTFETGETQIPEVPDTAVLLCQLANGALVNIHAGRAVPSGTGLTLSAYGSKGRLVARSPAYPLDSTVLLSAGRPARLFEGAEEILEVPKDYSAAPEGSPTNAVPMAPAALSLAWLYANMVRAIRNGGDTLPGFRRAAQVHSIVEAVQRSHETLRWQGISSIT